MPEPKVALVEMEGKVYAMQDKRGGAKELREVDEKPKTTELTDFSEEELWNELMKRWGIKI